MGEFGIVIRATTQNSNMIERFALYGYWLILIFVGILNHAIKNLIYRNSRYLEGDVESDKNHTMGTVTNVYSQFRYYSQQYLTLPSLFRDYHQRQLFWCTVPTRLEGFVIFSYWVLNIMLCCVSYRTFPGNF